MLTSESLIDMGKGGGLGYQALSSALSIHLPIYHLLWAYNIPGI